MVGDRTKQQATLNFRAVPLQDLKLNRSFLSKACLEFKVVGANLRTSSTSNSKDNSIYSQTLETFIRIVIKGVVRRVRNTNNLSSSNLSSIPAYPVQNCRAQKYVAVAHQLTRIVSALFKTCQLHFHRTWIIKGLRGSKTEDIRKRLKSLPTHCIYGKCSHIHFLGGEKLRGEPLQINVTNDLPEWHLVGEINRL